MTEYDFSTQRDWAEAGLTIEGLVRRYYAYVLRLASSILDDAHEAEDAVQETFIAVSRALPGYRGEGQVKTWLTAIAVNICRGHLRKRKVRWAVQIIVSSLQALTSKAGIPASPEEALIQSEVDRQLWQAVDGLDEKHRLPVILRYVHELTASEISVALGVSEGTVHSRLYYARQKLYLRLGSLNFREEASDESISS